MTENEHIPANSEEVLLALAKPLALAEVVPGVIHELNNPLFAVLGLLEFLLAEASPGTKTHQRLTLIQQSALEIKEIVRTVLDFAREREDDEAAQDVAEVVHEAAHLFRRTSVARDIETEITTSGGELRVVASRSRLKEVFLALLTNAQQAMPRGGKVSIGVARSNGSVVAAVTDAGSGIDAGTVPRLFEPFFTTRDEAGAYGVGLTIARAIVRRYGGELELEQTGPSGSKFVVRLPAA